MSHVQRKTFQLRVLKHDAFYFEPLVIYLFLMRWLSLAEMYQRSSPRPLWCTSATVVLICLWHTNYKAVSYFFFIIVMMPVYLQQQKTPSGTISHLFLSRIPACICPHFYSPVTGIKSEWSVHCSIFHLAPKTQQHILKSPLSVF